MWHAARTNSPGRVAHHTNSGGPVKRYEIQLNGMSTTLLLTDEDARKRGLVPAPAAVKAAPAPAAEPAADAVEAKAAEAPANKGRHPANKRRAASATKGGDS